MRLSREGQQNTPEAGGADDRRDEPARFLPFEPAHRAATPPGSLDQYLREISAYPLIDRDEEGILARKIRRGDRDALEKLVNSNLRFVVSIAKKYQNQGVALADLINETGGEGIG